ncbi:MAG: hypothetical protein ACKPKO_19275, partial [Candidatus Fonsibacter sp.]
MTVHKVGGVEASKHHALAMHATAGAAKVDVVRKKARRRARATSIVVAMAPMIVVRARRVRSVRQHPTALFPAQT